MSIDQKTVQKVARLARIGLTEEVEKQMMGELNKILDWVDHLSEVKTDGVIPVVNVLQEEELPMREDKVEQMNSIDAILKNAPETKENFFVVPKVVE